LLILMLGMQSVVLAAGIVLEANNSDTFKNRNDTFFAPNYTGPASVNSANIEFFRGSVPNNPTSTSGRISDFAYTDLGNGDHQYKNSGLAGGTVLIRSWDGTPRTEGSHYGIGPYATGPDAQTLTCASGASPALQYKIKPFKTDYLAGKPTNAPSITSVSEANQRIGDTTNVKLSLTVSFTYSEGTSPNKVVATGYDFMYWYYPEEMPDETDPGRVASLTVKSWSLPAIDPKTNEQFGGGTYYFRVRAKNVFGAGLWSDIKQWPTLSGVGGQCGPITYTLISPAEGIGINDISILHEAPFNVDTDPAESVSTVGGLVKAINAKAGANVVTAVGILTENQIQGAYVTYEDGNTIFTPTAGFESGADTVLVRGMALQISIMIEGGGNVEVTFF